MTSRSGVGGTGSTRARRLVGAAAAVVAIAATTVIVTSASAANPPELNAPERVYTPVNTTIDFTGSDDISGDNKALSVGGMVEAGCNTAGPNYSISNCPRIQMSLGNGDAGLLHIPGNTVKKNNVNADVIVAASGAVITEATDPAGGDSILFNFNGTTAQINSTLGALQFVPKTDYEEKDTNDAALPTLSIKAIQGDGSTNTDRFITIKVEGTNDGPTIGVPGTGTYDAPAGATTSEALSAVDNDMCSFTLCGLPYTNPGMNETDDQMLLVAWIPETGCGTFNWGGGAAFTSHGSATLTSVHAVLTAASGADLQDDQAAAIESSISPTALTLDLSTQPSSPTDSTTVFAGIADLDSIRNALDGFDYDAPSGDATCHVNVSLSDMGNNGMPKSYVGSAIGGPLENPEPGYEVPDAKGETTGLTFNVKDTHPDVTISQVAPSKAGDPLGPNKPGGFKITFSEAIEPSSFDATDLSLSTSSASGPALGALVPVTPGSVYTVPVTATGDGTLKLTFTGKAYLAGHDGDANYDNETPTYDDNEIEWDQTAPTATIAPWPGQADPAVSSPIEFKVTFSDTISTAPIGFDGSDVDLSTSTAGGTLVATVTQPDALDLKTYKVSITGMTSSGDVVAKVKSGAIVDQALNENTASSSSAVAWDASGAPSVTIDQAVAQSDPTSTSPVSFTVVFSEPVTGFTSGDVALSGTAGATLASVSGSGTTYTVEVSGMTQSGSVIAGIPSGVAVDATNLANTASTSVDNTVTFNKPADNTSPTVMIDQAAAQSDPTSTSPVSFTVVFSEPVTGFATGDVDLSGTAGATTAAVSGSGTTYTVDVSGMTQNGTVVASIPAGAAHDAANNASEASTSTDNQVTWNGAVTSLTISTAGGDVTLHVVGGSLTSFASAAPAVSPPSGVTFPFGQLSFTATVQPGALVGFTLDLPTNVDGYYKLSAGSWALFGYDGTTGAQINGSTVTLTIKDDGRGDSDVTAGQISDPGAPGVNDAAVTSTSTSTSTTSTTSPDGSTTTTSPDGSNTTTDAGGSTTTTDGTGVGSSTTISGDVQGTGTGTNGSGTSGGELARTGSSGLPALASVGVLLLGLGILVLRYRRRSQLA